ncbi:glycosyltransferase family 39 protein [Candidatus Roizmanbacteria bacterium]|nr:MAG: glycosyltransferase family 39 protein [Candidatus Roizmanbacteria bacterium]
MSKLTIKDILTAFILMIVAAIPRVILVDKIPLGIHGDEAWTALDALKIINEGPIPAYSLSALGQPSGPAYLTALFFRLFGTSVTTLRLSMAFFGIITVPLFYFFIKKLYGSTVSVIMTILFSNSLIHLHYSRIGFMLISAPLFVIGTLYFFSTFLLDKKYRSLMLSAVFCGLGMYSYNSYILFPPLLFLAFLYLWIIRRITWRHVTVFMLTFFVSASLLLVQLATDPKEYFSHHKTISVLNQAEFKNGDTGEKLQFMYENGLKKTKAFLIGHLNDGADGYGDYQSADYIILVFAVGGIVSAILKRNKFMLWLLIGLLVQMIPLFSTVDGYYRRVLIAYIFLYIFAAYALYMLISLSHGGKRMVLLTVVSLLGVAQIILNLWQYFTLFPRSSIAQFVFAPGVYAGLQQIPQNADILLYSERFGCDYETFRFLLNGRKCIRYSENMLTEDETKDLVKLYVDSHIPKGLEEPYAAPVYDRDNRIIAVIVR